MSVGNCIQRAEELALAPRLDGRVRDSDHGHGRNQRPEATVLSRSGQGKNENCKKTEGSRYGQQHSVQGGVSKPRIHDGGDDTANDDAAEEKLLLTTKRIRCPGVSA